MREPVPDFDLYAELEVSHRASVETIEAAWRSLMKRNHPDALGDRAAEERAKRLNIAHDWLTEPAHRALYDRTTERQERGAAPVSTARHTRTAPSPAEPRRSTAKQKDESPGATTPPPQPPPPPPSPPPQGAPVSGSSASAATRPAWTGKRRGEAGRIAIAAFALIGLVRILSLAGSGSAATATAPTSSFGTLSAGASYATASQAGPSPSVGTPVLASAAATSVVPAGATAPASDATSAATSLHSAVGTPVTTIAGSGDQSNILLNFAGGSYAFRYKVTAPTGNGCSWTLWLKKPGDILESPLAWTFPFAGKTASGTADARSINPGQALARVASECPSWSVAVDRIGP